jgi:hypothetical protein
VCSPPEVQEEIVARAHAVHQPRKALRTQRESLNTTHAHTQSHKDMEDEGTLRILARVGGAVMPSISMCMLASLSG